jgi:uncharacterized protein
VFAKQTIAAIFGANAAGKSNVIDAFAFMVSAARDSFRSWRRSDVPHTPFLLDEQSRTAESVFVVELLLDGTRWIYGFAVDAEMVREEWLHAYPQNRRRVVFDRSHGSVKIGSTIGLSRKLLKELTVAVPSSALFLSYLAEVESGFDNLPEAGRVYRWFQTAVNVLSVGDVFEDELAFTRRLEAAEVDSVERRRIIGLLVAADVGIVDVNVEFVISDRAAGQVDSRLVFLHGADKRPLFFTQESHGTRVWLGYLGPVLDALDSGGLLVVDEIDRSLHPHLTAQLIRLFRDWEINKKGAQLVFTTHDATLLGKNFGDQILGRDEIWFVEKSLDQATELFSLADFKARNEDNIERRYLTGTYGAIPQPAEHGLRAAAQGRSA